MKRRRSSAQRRAAWRLARMASSIQIQASGMRRPRPRPARDINAPTPPRWAKMFEGFGPSTTGWGERLADFDLLSPDFVLPEVDLPRLGPEMLDDTPEGS